MANCPFYISMPQDSKVALGIMEQLRPLVKDPAPWGITLFGTKTVINSVNADRAVVTHVNQDTGWSESWYQGDGTLTIQGFFETE